jgi:AraC-like DNA-binding protein
VLNQLGERFFVHDTVVRGLCLELAEGLVGKVKDCAHQNTSHGCQELLFHSNLNIADIGHKLGYSTSANFVRSFKALTGSTPAQFRRNPSTA